MKNKRIRVSIGFPKTNIYESRMTLINIYSLSETQRQTLI